MTERLLPYDGSCYAVFNVTEARLRLRFGAVPASGQCNTCAKAFIAAIEQRKAPPTD